MESEFTALTALVAPLRSDFVVEDENRTFSVRTEAAVSAPLLTASDVLGSPREAEPSARVLRQVRQALAQRVPDAERDRWYLRRRVLVAERGQRELSPPEKRELRMLEWRLDRLEEAELGDDLERLAAVGAAELQFAQKVTRIVSELNAQLSPHLPQARRRK